MSVSGTGAAVIDHVLIENNAEVGFGCNMQMGCAIRDSSIKGSLFYAVLAGGPVLVTNSHITGGNYAAVGLTPSVTTVIDHTVIERGTIGLQITGGWGASPSATASFRATGTGSFSAQVETRL
jgi:hypothetical protein